MLPRDGSYLLYGQDRTLLAQSQSGSPFRPLRRPMQSLFIERTLLTNRESWQLDDSFGSKILASSVVVLWEDDPKCVRHLFKFRPTVVSKFEIAHKSYETVFNKATALERQHHLFKFSV